MYAYEMIHDQRTTLMLCLLRCLPGDRSLRCHVARYATDDVLLPRLSVIWYSDECIWVAAPCASREIRAYLIEAGCDTTHVNVFGHSPPTADGDPVQIPSDFVKTFREVLSRYTQ